MPLTVEKRVQASPMERGGAFISAMNPRTEPAALLGQSDRGVVARRQQQAVQHRADAIRRPVLKHPRHPSPW